MKRSGRYATLELVEGQFEPGSRGRVLRNLLAIKSKRVKEVMHALAIVHVELLLIHPFWEGNGRLARMLASIMALQAELPPLDFSMLKGKKKQEYFVAVQAGISQNYEPMEKTFEQVIERTLRLRSRSFR